ncbi:MAG: hypothetical protein Kow0079_04900 [Vicingaceae bacterium]
MKNPKNIPQFFIVGAPKSGTTALYEYLKQHPQVQLAPKEIHFFGKDLGIIQDPLTAEQYLSYFDDQKINGDVSVWYLYASEAAKEIYRWNPEAKIIILLRSPKTMLPSLYLEHLKNGDENINDFNKALLNDKPHSTVNFKNRPAYFDAVSYYDQVKRYLELFGKEKVKIILYEHWQNDNFKVLKSLADWLQLTPFTFTALSKVNEKKQIKNVALQQALKQKPNFLKHFFRTVVPIKKWRHQIMQKALDFNKSDEIGFSISNSIEEKLTTITKIQAKKINQLTGIDCSIWLS